MKRLALFAFAFGVAALVEPPTTLAQAVCTGPDDCTRVADDASRAGDHERAYRALLAVCDSGYSTESACEAAYAEYRLITPARDAALQILAMGPLCQRGSNTACVDLAALYRTQDRPAAHSFSVLEVGCRRSHVASCRELARTRREASDYARACIVGDGDSCLRDLERRTDAERVQVLTRSCELGSAKACSWLGAAYLGDQYRGDASVPMTGLGLDHPFRVVVTPDATRGRSLLQRGCDLDEYYCRYSGQIGASLVRGAASRH